MPWAPEQFSAPVLERLQEKLGHEVETVPFFDGIIAGEFDALVGSFAGEPELHHPVRGRIRGVRALEAYVADTNAWIGERNISIEQIELVMTERHGFGEAALQLDGETGRVELPVAVVADKHSDGGIEELRVYYSSWPLTGRHAIRPPLLQPDPDLRESGVVGEYQRALAAGDVEAVVAAFEPDGYAREPAGGAHHPPRPPGGRRPRPPRARRAARVLRASVLGRRRHPAGALRGRRRRPRVRARVQRRALGGDRPAAGGGGGPLRPRGRRPARRPRGGRRPPPSPHLRPRRPAARAGFVAVAPGRAAHEHECRPGERERD